MNRRMAALVVVALYLASMLAFSCCDSSAETRGLDFEAEYKQPFLYYSGTVTGVPEGTLITADLGDNGSIVSAFTTVDSSGSFSGTVRLNNVKDGTYNLRIRANPVGEMSFSVTKSIKISSDPNYKAVTGITLSDASLEVVEGEVRTVGYTLLPGDATNKTINWYSSNPEVARIDDGKLYARNAGEATITAKTSTTGVEASLSVKVGKLSPSIPQTIEITISGGSEATMDLEVKGVPKDGDYTIEWASSNPDVASISPKADPRGSTLVGKSEGKTSVTATVFTSYGLSAVAKCDVTVKKSAATTDNLYTFEISMDVDADMVKHPKYTTEMLESGIKISARGSNAAEALSKACSENAIPLDLLYTDVLKGWIITLFGLGDVKLDGGKWKYWIQYYEGSYNQYTLGYYTDGGTFQLIYGITDEGGGSAEDPNKGTNVKDNPDGSQTVSKSESGTEEDGTKFVRDEDVTTNPDGSQTITKVETKDNPDGSQTVTKEDTVKNPDGSISSSSKIETVSKTETGKDGTKTETITEKRTDSSGSSSEKESTVTTNKDGTKTETTKETSTSSDGTSVVKESTATVSKDGKVQETGTETSKDASGKVTGTTEYTKESATESDGTKKETTDETFKDVSGEVTGSKQTTVEEKKNAGGSKTTTTEVSKDVYGAATGSKETVSEEKKTSGGSSTSTVETVRDANGDKTSVKKTETVIKNSILAGGKTGMTTTFTETTKDGSGKTTGSVESVEDVVKGGGTISVKHSETAKDASGSVVSKYEFTSERTEKMDGEITEISATKVAGDVKEKSETTILNMKDGTYSKDVSTTTTSPEGTKQKDVSTSSSKLEDGTKTTESVTEKVKDSSGKEVSSSERSSEVVDTSVEKSEKVTEKTSAGGSVSESVKASIDAKDGSSSTEAEVSMKDGSVVKAESTTTVAAEGTVGADVIGSAVKQSEAAVGMVSSEGTDVKKTLEIEGDGATLSPEALGMIADHGASLRIGGTGGSGTMTFDDDVCENLSDQKGDVGFSMEEGDTGDLNEKQKDVVGDRFFLVLGATVGDGMIHELGGTARIAFGYAPSEGQDPAKLSVYYVDADGNRTRMDSSFDPATGMFSMTTTHFSVFMVAAEEEPVSEPSSDGDGSALLIGAAVAAIIAIAIAAVCLIRARKV